MSEYEISLEEGENTIELVEGDNVLTLGVVVPVTSLLGTPSDGSWTDGQVTLTANTSVADAIDALNEALLTVATTPAENTHIGAPTDGSFSDGYVSGWSAATKTADAVDAINEALLIVANASAAAPLLGVATDGSFGDGYVGGWTNTTRVADAADALNEGLLTVSGVANGAAMAAASAALLGTPTDGNLAGGYVAGWSGSTRLTDAVDDLNESLLTVNNVANAPGQRAAGAPAGGWGAGYVTLTNLSLIADALNSLNVGMQEVFTVADGAVDAAAAAAASAAAAFSAAANAALVGTPTDGSLAGGYIAGWTGSTRLGDAVDDLNESLLTVSNAAAAAASAASAAQTTANAPGQRAIGASTDGSWAGQVTITNTTLIADAVDALNTSLATVSSTASSAATAAATAQTTANAPGQRAIGASTDGSWTGQVTITNATLIADAVDALNTSLATVSSAAAAAQTTANAPGQRAIGASTDGSWAGQVTITNSTLIADAVDALNTGLATVASTASSASTAAAAAQTTADSPGVRPIGTPTDGSWTDGLATVTGTTSVADAVDSLNEALKAITQNGYTFTGLTLSGALSGTSATFSSTLNVTGATTLAGLSAGATTLGALTGTSASFSGALSAGATTLSGALAGTSATFSSTLAASTSATVAGRTIYTNFATLGANDQYAQQDGYFYKVYDMEENFSALYSTFTSGTNNTAGGGFAGPRNDDANQTNNASVDSANHIGVMGVFTLNTGYAGVHRNVSYAFGPGQGVTTTIRILFRTPAAASNATNDYTFYVGASTMQASNPGRGWYLKYRHSTNSGNWQIASVNIAASGEVTANTSVAFTANAWHTLTITLPASGSAVAFSLTVGGVTSSLGTVTNTAMEAPASQAISSTAGIMMVRNASDGTTYRAGYLDRASVYASGQTGMGT